MKRASRQFFALAGGLLLSALLLSCGGGGGDLTGSTTTGGGTTGGGTTGGGTTTAPTGSNVVAASVSPGATGQSFNTLFVSVTVCVPGTSTCQVIPNVQVDTGSYGLRILGQALTVTLPTQTATGGGTLAECVDFVDGFTWGPVALADVTIGGEKAGSVPLQLIGDSRFPNPASDCAALGNSSNNGEEDTVATFGANGILGIGPFQYDCGTACRDSVVPTTYYACSSTSASSCTATSATLAQQVQSVVSLFATDNNGVIIQLPTPTSPAAGQATMSGYLIFGIDTQTNNASGTETVLTTDQYGEFPIAFQGTTYDQSFIDSGTNGNYFTSSIPVCTNPNIPDFYCPTSEQVLTATITGINLVKSVVSFDVDNALTMLSNNDSFAVFPNLAGTYPGGTPTFDFGLPFFYGRRVAVAMEGETTSVGTGPYFAF